MKKHCFLFALFIFLSSLYMQAEGTAGKWSERYNFTAITMDEGLPHNFVDDILKDSQGFLWIATRGDRKSTRLNSSHYQQSRMPSSA